MEQYVLLCLKQGKELELFDFPSTAFPGDDTKGVPLTLWILWHPPKPFLAFHLFYQQNTNLPCSCLSSAVSRAWKNKANSMSEFLFSLQTLQDKNRRGSEWRGAEVKRLYVVLCRASCIFRRTHTQVTSSHLVQIISPPFSFFLTL